MVVSLREVSKFVSNGVKQAELYMEGFCNREDRLNLNRDITGTAVDSQLLVE